jgi:hypothetical protein
LTLLNLSETAVGMAFEAIYLHAGVKVTTSTKMLWVGVADCSFSALGGIVAIHATDQAVFAVAFTVKHRVIALMQQQIHVLAAHHLDWLDTGTGVVWFTRLRDGDSTEA